MSRLDGSGTVPGDRHEEVFSLSDFSKGVSFLTGTSESGNISIKSRNFLVTPEGHISFNSGCVAATPLVCDEIGVSGVYYNERVFEHLNRIYYWNRPAGAGVLLACSSHAAEVGKIYRFSTGAEQFTKRNLTYGYKMGFSLMPSVTGTKGLLWPMALRENCVDSEVLEVECRSDVFIDFVPYGEYCFVFDGTNAPLVIYPNLTVARAASPVLGSCLHVRTSNYGLLDGVETGSYVYAFVPVLGSLGLGRTGFSKTSDDESFVAVSVDPIPVKADGNWGILTLTDLIAANQHSISIMPIGVEEDSTQGGWVFFGNFQSYFDTIPSLSEIQIYRTRRGTAGLFYYVGSVRDGEDTFLDTTPDRALGTELELGKKDPPVARLGATYQDRLFTVGSNDENQRNLIRFSERFRPLLFPEDWFIYAPNLLTDDEIVRAVVVGGGLFFLTRRATLRLVGETPADYSLAPVSMSVGCVAPRTVAQYKDGVIFLSAEGPVYFDGNSFTDLSGGLKNYFAAQGRSFRSWSNFAAATASRDYYYLAVSEDFYNDSKPSSRNNKVFACCLRNGAWSEAFVVPFDDGCQTADMRAYVSSNIRQSASLGSLPEGGGVYELRHDFPYTWVTGSPTTAGTGVDDPGNGLAALNADTWFDDAIPRVWWEGLDLGMPDVRKSLDRIEVEYVGYIDNAFSLAIQSDSQTSATFVGPDNSAYSGTPPIQWGVAHGSRSSAARTVRQQIFYATTQEPGSTFVGKTFDVKLRGAYYVDWGGYYSTWLVIRRITFYFHTEDIH